MAIYMPETSSSVAGNVSMGFTYDSTDTLPVGIAGMSNLDGFTTTNVWSGSSGAPLLSSNKPWPRSIPEGAVATCLDSTRLSKPWYPFKGVPPTGDDGNIYTPGQLVVAVTTPTTLTASSLVGRIYFRYQLELIEPTAVGTNSLSTGPPSLWREPVPKASDTTKAIASPSE